MKRIACALLGHDDIPVREVGIVARPGGILPMVDGLVAYEAAADGEHRACNRCRRVKAAA